MCIGFWALDHGDYALILFTNRDEILQRPTTEAHFHTSDNSDGSSNEVLSGRDILAGGTWFGVNRTGRVALLTNITEEAKPFTSSRGHLVSSFLSASRSGGSDSTSLESEVERLKQLDTKFSGFNLLLLCPAPSSSEHEAREFPLRFDATFVTNGRAGGDIRSRPLSHNERLTGAISNGVDDAGGNDWPKVKHGLEAFTALLRDETKTAESALVEELFHLLTYKSPDPVTQRSELRNTIHIEPIPIPIKVDPSKGGDAAAPTPLYGTRLSTVLLIRKDGEVLFIERDIWKIRDGKPCRVDGPATQREFRFTLDTV